MNNNCFKPDSIPELQKKDISVNIGRPSKITHRKPAEKILIEKDYSNILGHLIIQNETLTQLKKEIEYKLKKLKDEEKSLNFLHKKYNSNNDNKEEDIEEDGNEKHIKLFEKAQKEWEERKQELINGNYISANIDNNINNNDLTYSLASNIFSSNDSTFNAQNKSTDFSYPNSENDSNFNNAFNFDSVNNTNEPFSLSPGDFSLSPFNLENIENLDALDPNLMNLDIDFDMNLLDIDNIGIDAINNNISQTMDNNDINNNNNINLLNIDLSNNNDINIKNINNISETTDSATNNINGINYLEPELSNIMKILNDNSNVSLSNDLINPNLELSKILNEIPEFSSISNTQSLSNNLEDEINSSLLNNNETLMQIKNKD
ncbi:hypothetical protein BCR36DRAFT_328787, partial [Piromyces finnis]